MDLLLIFIGSIFMLLGLIGSFLPVLPGPPLSWLGLFGLSLTEAIPSNWTFLGITLTIAVAITILDYWIPAVGAKRYGGSRKSMIGSVIGMIVGLLSPIPFGIIIGTFLGAYVGELLNDSDEHTAAKSASGALLGFLVSSLMKFVLGLIYFGLFMAQIWEYRSELF